MVSTPNLIVKSLDINLTIYYWCQTGCKSLKYTTRRQGKVISKSCDVHYLRIYCCFWYFILEQMAARRENIWDSLTDVHRYWFQISCIDDQNWQWVNRFVGANHLFLIVWKDRIYLYRIHIAVVNYLYWNLLIQNSSS